MAVREPKTAALRPGEALLRLRDNPFDESAILGLVGDRNAATHAEVAAEFGVQPNTVRQSWAPSGMPGSQGAYPLAEIARWRLQHLAEADRRRRSVEDLTAEELKRRHSEAEARKLEAQADRLEREEQVALGNLIDRESAGAAVKAAAAFFAEQLDGIADQFAPFWGVDVAQDRVEELRNMHRRILDRFRETSTREIARGS